MEKREFVKQFLKDRKMIGAMRPSSRFLMRKMIGEIDFSNAKILVEFGPGTGVFTKEVVSRMKEDAQFFIFELNENFFEKLNSTLTDPRCHVINDSAEKLAYYLEQHQLSKADVILSSLPLANFDSELRENILLAASNSLSQNGKFLQFQYSTQSKGILKKIFSKVQVGFTLWNLPPAFVYSCQH